MSRDFRYRAEAKRHRLPSVWPPFTVGLLIGALGVGGAWLKFASDDAERLVTQCPEDQSAQPASTDDEPGDALPKPVFDYPQILPTMEVVVPDELADQGTQVAVAPPEVRREVVETKPPPRSGEVLMIQVAAVKTLADAERLKARLALSGLQAQIEPAKINNQLVYRVRLGPYSRMDDLQGPRSRLATIGYPKSLVVRLK